MPGPKNEGLAAPRSAEKPAPAGAEKWRPEAAAPNLPVDRPSRGRYT
jgi:hypothetical protein